MVKRRNKTQNKQNEKIGFVVLCIFAFLGLVYFVNKTIEFIKNHWLGIIIVIFILVIIFIFRDKIEDLLIRIS